jgi:hypothetical protein
MMNIAIQKVKYFIAFKPPYYLSAVSAREKRFLILLLVEPCGVVLLQAHLAGLNMAPNAVMPQNQHLWPTRLHPNRFHNFP